jgi:hypothetical protein
MAAFEHFFFLLLFNCSVANMEGFFGAVVLVFGFGSTVV